MRFGIPVQDAKKYMMREAGPVVQIVIPNPENMIGVKTIWTTEMDNFLRSNYQSKTNQQLAFTLGLKLTITRNRLRELGLKRMEMEYWNDEQIQYLKDNFQTTGDVEIAEYFQENYPKNKIWRKQHIRKKRGYLDLHRTKEEIFTIASMNAKPGGNSHTIDQNSSSKNMHPKWVAQQIAWRNKELQEEVLKYPELIQLKRVQLDLARTIKKQRNGKNN